MKYVRDVRTLDPRTVVVTCQGEVGIAAVEELHQAVDPLLEGPASHLVFDLTAAEYLSSHALEVLEAASHRVRKKRGRVSLVGANSLVCNGLKVFSLDLLVDLYDRIEEVPIGGHRRPARPKKAWSANVRQARAARKTERVCATGVRFVGDMLQVSLSDGREIGVPLDRVEWLGWLVKATPRQRSRWSIEPGGLAIYWEDLDDGIEVRHLLGMQPLAEEEGLQ